MIISVCKETADFEKRVALTPEGAAALIKQGYTIEVESGAGAGSSYPDAAYEAAGATIIKDAVALFSNADLLLAVQTPAESLLQKMKKNATLACFLWALQNKELVQKLMQLGITALGMDAIPRISRAQSMDALSSMSNIAGYKAVLMGASKLDRYFPMMMTAAGTVPPAKVLVLGAGVAGLQAIATAKRLGAVVEAFDVRPVVKEQVESLGAKFVEVPLEEEETETKGGYAKELSQKNQEKQREVIHEHVKKSNLVITTALIPGKQAPILITKKMVDDMLPGSVIVDLAAENGGNCEYTKTGETAEVNGVYVMGPVNVPSTLAFHASQLLSKNMLSLLSLLLKDGGIHFDFEDEIVLNTTITHNNEMISPTVKQYFAA